MDVIKLNTFLETTLYPISLLISNPTGDFLEVVVSFLGPHIRPGNRTMSKPWVLITKKVLR